MRDDVAARREKLLVSARGLFACYGFHATAIAQISERSGVAVGQIYRDFANKEAIVAAVVEAGMGNLFAELSSFRDWASNGEEETCKGIGNLLLRVVSDDSCQLILEFFAESSRNPAIASYLHVIDNRARTELIRTFATADRANVDVVQLGKIADLFLACLSGIAVRTIANPTLELSQLIAAMSQMIACQLFDINEAQDR